MLPCRACRRGGGHPLTTSKLSPSHGSVWKRSASLAFKSQQIIRYYDPKRKAFAYLVYSDKIVQGSPKNSLSAVSSFGGAKADAQQVAGAEGKQIYGACVVDAPVPTK